MEKYLKVWGNEPKNVVCDKKSYDKLKDGVKPSKPMLIFNENGIVKEESSKDEILAADHSFASKVQTQYQKIKNYDSFYEQLACYNKYNLLT